MKKITLKQISNIFFEKMSQKSILKIIEPNIFSELSPLIKDSRTRSGFFNGNSNSKGNLKIIKSLTQHFKNIQNLELMIDRLKDNLVIKKDEEIKLIRLMNENRELYDPIILNFLNCRKEYYLLFWLILWSIMGEGLMELCTYHIALNHNTTLTNNILYYTPSNSEDAANIDFFLDLIRNHSDICILSKDAKYCAIKEGEINHALNLRLSTDNNFTIKMILQLPVEYNETSYTNKHITNCIILEQLSNRFPNNFFIRYFKGPLKYRLYFSESIKIMRVEHFINYDSPNVILPILLDGKSNNERLLYEEYVNQFAKLWIDYTENIRIS